MKSDKSEKVFFNYRDNHLQPVQTGVVSEYPVQLIVNSREIATLIGSPHDLRFLVAGFLRLQGFVSSLTDFEMFSVCEDFGTANVRIKGELPERLKPVLTSGCGTGISFSMPTTLAKPEAGRQDKILAAHIFSLMEELSKKADHYRSHGGIHSAAIGRSGKLLLYAEDLGRHNTFDRIAGEALFKGIELAGTDLVTSGRVSTEMVAKASLMGIKLIASRTSPTDMAVKLCDQADICLVGYVRGGSFNVYSHPEAIEDFSSNTKIPDVTGVILAGGASSRMGTNKALLEVNGSQIVTHTYRTLAALFHEVIIVTNSPQDYEQIPCRKAPDIYPDIGSIAGLHSALVNSTTSRTFVTACDMPFVNPHIIRYICSLEHDEYDAVIPFSEGGQEPLHAVYATECRSIFENAINNGERKILDILKRMKTRHVSWEEMKAVDGSSTSFLNVNTPEEYNKLKDIR
jgi:FdhD protein